MRKLLYAAILASLFFSPLERLDVAKLQPVQTVAMQVTQEGIKISTDTQSHGIGKTVADAVADLEENTPGVIYLDTAQYLLLTESAMAVAEQLRPYLRPSVYVCKWDGEGSVAEAAKYLSVRKDLPRFKAWNPPLEKS